MHQTPPSPPSPSFNENVWNQNTKFDLQQLPRRHHLPPVAEFILNAHKRYNTPTQRENLRLEIEKLIKLHHLPQTYADYIYWLDIMKIKGDPVPSTAYDCLEPTFAIRHSPSPPSPPSPSSDDSETSSSFNENVWKQNTNSSYSCKLGERGVKGDIINRGNCNNQISDGSVNSRCKLTSNGYCRKAQSASTKRGVKHWNLLRNTRRAASSLREGGPTMTY